MGKYLNKFRNGKDIATDLTRNVSKRANDYGNRKVNQKRQFREGKIVEQKRDYGIDDLDMEDNMFDGDEDGIDNDYSDVHVMAAQKPESFHHFILENKYKDLEKSIRGYKDYFDKDKQCWQVKRKSIHCFTDEESEEILRTAQSHLATDIKLTFYDKKTFGIRFLAVYDKMEFLFKRIMEYRFGRFGDSKKQGQMKDQALKIFVELITRVEANYLMAIQGMENKRTHEGIQSQESLQGRGDDIEGNRSYS